MNEYFFQASDGFVVKTDVARNTSTVRICYDTRKTNVESNRNLNVIFVRRRIPKKLVWNSMCSDSINPYLAKRSAPSINNISRCVTRGQLFICVYTKT